MNIEFCTYKDTDDKQIIITSDYDDYPWHQCNRLCSRSVISDVDNNCDIKEVYKDYIVEIISDNKIVVEYIDFMEMFLLLSDYFPNELKDDLNK